MRMFRLSVVAAAIGAIASTSLALAQTPGERQQQEQLKKLLEEKFGNRQAPSTTRSVTPPRPAAPPSDLRVIRPDGSIQKMPGQRSQAPSSSLILSAAGAAAAPRIQAPSREDVVLAQAPVVRRNSYVIQLKPNSSSAQIDALLSKYNLTVERYVASLGLLYVVPRDRSATRSLSSERETVQNVLEPRIIVNLRNEPIVDSAYVHSTINSKSVPPSPPDIKARSERSGQTLRWQWQDGNDDGNWGLKVMRMPPVWTILDRMRSARGDSKRVGIIVLDTGFGPHPQLTFSEVQGRLPAGILNASCGRSHGTHVAGIAAATFGQGKGIDGMVPDAKVAAIPISRGLFDDAVKDGLDDAAEQTATYFLDAIFDLVTYIDDLKERQLLKAGDRRVVNVSLAYNWTQIARSQQVRPTDRAAIRNHVRAHAKTIFRLVNQVRDQVLFVAAAGNDSEGQPAPLTAELATPFAFASLNKSPEFTPVPRNIIVVEAQDRSGRRAPFSNVGGHVAAPGVDIMSTFASVQNPYGVCDGTSQAAPHITALASILFELNSDLTPTQAGDIIRSTANPPVDPAMAPMADGLAAVLKAVPGAYRLVADLNRDGKVDMADMIIFRDALVELQGAKFGGQPYTTDLNGDGVVDRNEACFPRVDLNGSGRASYDAADKRPVEGAMRSDVDVLELAWTDTAKPFKDALAETGLEDLLNAWQETRIVAAAALPGVRPPCN
jgi:hypothetical protein